MQSDFERLRRNIEGIRNDTSTPDTRYSDHPSQPLSNTGITSLINLTMGGHRPAAAGALLICQLRYFDPRGRRPGLPKDVAALITEMSNEMTKVTIVNINQSEPRDVIVQTGGYGEHQCLRVETSDGSFPVDNRFFTLRLARGAGAELTIYHRRFVNKPTAAFPWHGDRVPLKQ